MMGSVVFYTLPASKALTEEDRRRQIDKIFVPSSNDRESMEKSMSAASNYIDEKRKKEPDFTWELSYWHEVEIV